jgi:hypothetical protein
MTDSELIAKLMKLAERLVIDHAMNNCSDRPPIVEFKDDNGMLTMGSDLNEAMRDIVVEVIRFREMRETGE